jgi:hypothetical protein
MIGKEHFRAVEGRLYHYRDMCQQVSQYRLSHWGLRSVRPQAMPRGQALRSDPTASCAMALAAPPEYIDRLNQWIDTIDRALERLWERSELLYSLAREYYINCADPPGRRRVDDLCRSMGLERALFYQYRRQIVHTVYMQALYDHLMDPQ